MSRHIVIALALVCAYALGGVMRPTAAADGGGFDRALAERLVRAVEDQARALQRCK